MKHLIILLMALMTSVPALAALTREGAYEVEKDHSNIGFSVSHMGISLVVGRFNSFSGEVSFVPDGESSVSFEVDVASVDTNQVRRDRHLRSGDFFDATTHPKMRFNSTSVEYTAEGDPAMINGNLTLKGVTKPVSFQVQTLGAGDDGRNFRVGYIATSTIRRTEFGMDKLLAAAGDEVTIKVNIELIDK